MVRLKVKSVIILAFISASFNSKMVRLKEIINMEKRSVAITFQFQNGSIKSYLWKMDNGSCNRVSIPKWFD